GKAAGDTGAAAFRVRGEVSGSVCCTLRPRRQCRRRLPCRPTAPSSGRPCTACGPRPMSNPAHDALIHLMIVAASSDSAMTERELLRIRALIDRLPVFADFDHSRLEAVA